ncbi:MAG TPA: hypothetical protein PLB21_01535 [Actinomycetota bacterium]|nr:hypothetical protein [Actinomycetota bacterium]
MDVGSAVRLLLRRWLVVLLGLVVTFAAAYVVYNRTPPRYQATARMLLLLPADARGTEDIGSPFLYLPNGLSVLANVVIASPTSRESRAEMAATDLHSQFELDVDVASPTITISVEGSDPANVIETRDWLIDKLESQLLIVQAEEGAPSQQTARARVYAAEDQPAQISGDRWRSILGIVAAGALMSLMAAFAIDRLIDLYRQRARRRAAAAAAAAPPESDDGHPDLDPQAVENLSAEAAGSESIPGNHESMAEVADSVSIDSNSDDQESDEAPDSASQAGAPDRQVIGEESDWRDEEVQPGALTPTRAS